MIYLRQNPFIGMVSGFLVWVLPYIQWLTPYVQFLGICLGVCVGGLTAISLFLDIRKKLKE